VFGTLLIWYLGFSVFWYSGSSTPYVRFIGSINFSLSLPIVNKAPCLHCHLLLLLKSRARDKTLSTHAPGSLSPAPCSTSTTLSRQPIHSAYLRRTLTPASVCSTSRVSRRAGQATNPLTPAMPRPYLRVMVSLAEAWRLKSSVATRAIGTGCP